MGLDTMQTSEDVGSQWVKAWDRAEREAKLVEQQLRDQERQLTHCFKRMWEISDAKKEQTHLEERTAWQRQVEEMRKALHVRSAEAEGGLDALRKEVDQLQADASNAHRTQNLLRQLVQQLAMTDGRDLDTAALTPEQLVAELRAAAEECVRGRDARAVLSRGMATARGELTRVAEILQNEVAEKQQLTERLSRMARRVEELEMEAAAARAGGATAVAAATRGAAVVACGGVEVEVALAKEEEKPVVEEQDTKKRKKRTVTTKSTVKAKAKAKAADKPTGAVKVEAATDEEVPKLRRRRAPSPQVEAVPRRTPLKDRLRSRRMKTEA